MQCSHTLTRCSKQNWFVTFLFGHLQRPMEPGYSRATRRERAVSVVRAIEASSILVVAEVPLLSLPLSLLLSPLRVSKLSNLIARWHVENTGENNRVTHARPIYHHTLSLASATSSDVSLHYRRGGRKRPMVSQPSRFVVVQSKARAKASDVAIIGRSDHWKTPDGENICNESIFFKYIL